MTFEELLEILAEQFGCDPADLRPGTELAELGADREDMVELAWQLGEGVGTELDEDELAACATVGAIWQYLKDLDEE